MLTEPERTSELDALLEGDALSSKVLEGIPEKDCSGPGIEVVIGGVEALYLLAPESHRSSKSMFA